MQEFLTNNTVNCNLMSLTGYRTLIILSLLMESPKSATEINDYFLNHQYIKENFSNDTLRIYINSLRAIGCEITRANKANNNKYELKNHPFFYDIPKSQLNALIKLYKAIYHNLTIQEIIAIEQFIQKILKYIQNENTKDLLKKASVIKNVDINLLEDLIIHCKNKNQITFLYNSPKSGAKEIEIIADKLSFKNEKLYLWGNNLTHKEYSFFLTEKIQKIYHIKLMKEREDFPEIKVRYELYGNINNHIIEEDEKIIEKQKNKLIIEATTKNEFQLIQRLLYFTNDCKIISPQTFKTNFRNKLKTMEKQYV